MTSLIKLMIQDQVESWNLRSDQAPGSCWPAMCAAWRSFWGKKSTVTVLSLVGFTHEAIDTFTRCQLGHEWINRRRFPDREVLWLEKIPQSLDVRVKRWSENENMFCLLLLPFRMSWNWFHFPYQSFTFLSTELYFSYDATFPSAKRKGTMKYWFNSSKDIDVQNIQ